MSTKRNFPDLEVDVPDQADGNAVTIRSQPLGPPSSMPNGQGFTLGRLIANIIINRAGEKPEDTLDPAATLTITLTQADVKRAAGEYFKIAYWSGGGGWVILKDNIPSKAGDVEVAYDKLGDPPIGAGP